MSTLAHPRPFGNRRGAIMVLAAVFMVIMLGLIALSLDLGYICLTKTELQNAADSAAMAAASHLAADTEASTEEAEKFAAYHKAGGTTVGADSVDVDFGTWDVAAREFTASDIPGNAVRVTTRRDAMHGGQIGLFFAPILGRQFFSCSASAVALSNPRDIVFVIDLSGSMNNDTEPAWATGEINNAFGADYPDIGGELMQKVYDDFGYGAFPGTLQWVGSPLGVAADQYAYAEMTKTGGPLSLASIASTYKIGSSDSEATRKTKAYKWMIDQQIAVVMPDVQPAAVSSNSASLAYWTKYLDYVLQPQQIRSTSSKGKPRPAYPVTLPPSQSSNRITGFANPYQDAFPGADTTVAGTFCNKIGYRTYVQFMMDFGRDGKPTTGQLVPLSWDSALCPKHDEETDGGIFRFPPREQPTHATRRAIIAALQVIKERNANVSEAEQRDWVSLVTFDRAGSATILKGLTPDYDAAMQSCVSLQAVADDALSTATELGLLTAKNHIASPVDGGQGRPYANKVVVLLTDGIPNLQTSSVSAVRSFIGENPSENFYISGSYANEKNAALMQSTDMQMKKWLVFPVGIGLGTDYDFMDRGARQGGTANPDGECARGSGNPAEYEQRLKDIFQNIITNPKARLVQ